MRGRRTAEVRWSCTQSSFAVVSEFGGGHLLVELSVGIERAFPVGLCQGGRFDYTSGTFVVRNVPNNCRGYLILGMHR